MMFLDQSLFLTVGCVEIVPELAVVRVHLLQSCLHLRLVCLAVRQHGTVVAGALLGRVCNVLVVPLLQEGCPSVQLALVVLLPLEIGSLPVVAVVGVLLVLGSGRGVAGCFGGGVVFVEPVALVEVGLERGGGLLALTLNFLSLSIAVAHELFLTALVSGGRLLVLFGDGANLLVELVSVLLALLGHCLMLLQISLKIVLHNELLINSDQRLTQVFHRELGLLQINLQVNLLPLVQELVSKRLTLNCFGLPDSCLFFLGYS